MTKELVRPAGGSRPKGKLIRPAGEFKLAVTTGIDWFELGGQVDFGGQSVALPDLLAAARRGETMVTLGDGSMGMLPEDWLKKYGMLADLGVGSRTSDGGSLRFGKAQAGLLDALLASQPEIKLDIGFGKVRQNLPRFEGVTPRRPRPASAASSGPTSARGWAGSNTSRSSTSAASWPTTWAWARPCRSWPCSRAAGPGGSVEGAEPDRGPAVAGVQLEGQEAEKFCPRLRVLDYTGTEPPRDPRGLSPTTT